MTKLERGILVACFLAGAATPTLLRPTLGGRDSRSLSPAGQTPVRALAASQAPRESAAMGRLREWLRQRPDQPPRGQLEADELWYLVWALPASDYARAWRWSEGLPSGIQGDVRSRILVYWAQVDPAAALKACWDPNQPWVISNPARGVLMSWAGRHPAEALSWIERAEPTNRTALAQAIAEAASTDPAAASGGSRAHPARPAA